MAAGMRNSCYGRLVMLSMLNRDTEKFPFPSLKPAVLGLRQASQAVRLSWASYCEVRLLVGNLPSLL